MNQPYGGKLVNRFVKKSPGRNLEKLPKIVLSNVALSDMFNIAEGVFSPLEGFMTGKQFKETVRENRLGRLPWTMPILLDVERDAALAAGRRGKAALIDGAGQIVGTIAVADVYEHDKEAHIKSVFGTSDKRHPGVAFTCAMKDYLVGGEISVFGEDKRPIRYLSPRQTREIFAKKKLKTIAGFQTRNVLHRAHEYLQRCALELVDGLFLQPIAGWKKSGDFTAEAVVKAYQEFINDYYPKERVVLGTLKTAMRYAGPKEAVFHAIIRRNFGCTHFIVGRDHAGVGGYYGKYEAQDIFDSIGDLGITILKFKEPLYCSKCDLIVTEKTCGHGAKYHQEISGTLVREVIKKGKQPEHQLFRPEVYALLEREFKDHRLFYE
jgi:sulfate adenylyltransferase